MTAITAVVQHIPHLLKNLDIRFSKQEIQMKENSLPFYSNAVWFQFTLFAKLLS
jgi:hypothetical protein